MDMVAAAALSKITNTQSGRKAFDIPKLKKWLEDEREYRKKYGSVGLEPSDVTLIMMYLARTYPPTNMESRRQDCLLFPPVIDTISPHIKKAFPIQSKYLNEMLTHLNWMKTLKPMYRENEIHGNHTYLLEIHFNMRESSFLKGFPQRQTH
ncbi:14799_t:CDS:2 [Funneliformis geosporum]|nr:14799_t:CDS:2 [Funneliformis geosporum]